MLFCRRTQFLHFCPALYNLVYSYYLPISDSLTFYLKQLILITFSLFFA
nr:MAG TPA: hypothetical protein [Caudoviricetes sp.]